MAKIIVTPELVKQFDEDAASGIKVIERLDEPSAESLLCANMGDDMAGIRVMAFAIWYAAVYGVPG